MAEVLLDGKTLTPAALERAARGATVGLDDDARARMEETARWYRNNEPSDIIRRKWHWLGAGSPPQDSKQRIRTFIESHCGGVGEPLPKAQVRAILAARANVLATGTTGCRPECADALIEMLNRDVVPEVPGKGSVGSAAPAPLAHILRVACGFGGRALRNGVPTSAREAMAGLNFVEPTEKEALTLINGATLTAALAGLTIPFAERLLHTAEMACALSFEVVRADPDCLSPLAIGRRNHPGAIGVASRLRHLLQGSQLVVPGRNPDPFSIRCAPAVLGAAQDALQYVKTVVQRELNGACDNPLVFPETGTVEAGNFHAAPVALAMDHLKVALTQVASIAERRVFRMTYGQLSGLPSFLVPNTGLNSGLMLAQYTAASLVSECKVLAHPASVDSIPTVQHLEDHVSMGPTAARGALTILEILADVIAIELLCAAQGLDFHIRGRAVDPSGKLVEVPSRQPGHHTRQAWEAVRQMVEPWEDDRALHPELEVLGSAVRGGLFSYNIDEEE
ncbi:MAG: aromatic amino acid lyase [Proteobacteria bacterium]|nr:aromatic amino acid lyase [Pseudomonadota bacterium]